MRFRNVCYSLIGLAITVMLFVPLTVEAVSFVKGVQLLQNESTEDVTAAFDDYLDSEESDVIEGIDAVPEETDLPTEPIVVGAEDSSVVAEVEDLETVDEQDAYDYSTGASASFDTSFVDDGSASTSVSNDTVGLDQVNSLIASGSELTPTEEIYLIGTMSSGKLHARCWGLHPDAEVVSGYYDIPVSSGTVECDIADETPTAPENVSEFLSELYTYTMLPVVDKDGKSIGTAIVVDKGNVSASADFSYRVGTLIDAGQVTVVQSINPECIGLETTAKGLFNRFDDKVSAKVQTRVTMWEDFYSEYDTWVNSRDDILSVAFVCYDNAENGLRNFEVLAYSDTGSRIDSLVFETEMEV